MRGARIWLAAFVGLMGCSEAIVIPEGHGNDPVFGFSGVIDGVEQIIGAGENQSYMFTGASLNSMGVPEFWGRLALESCDSCGPSLTIVLRSASASEPALESLETIGFRYFTGPEPLLAPAHFLYEFWPLDTINNLSHFWDFGDGNISTQAMPTHVIQANSGAQQVSHFVTAIGGDTCSAALSNTIDPSSSCSGYFDYQVYNGDHVAFFTNYGPSATITWNFGDGSSGSGANPTHDYDGPGNYLVWVMVMDTTTGCLSQFQRDIHVGVQTDCSAGFNYSRSYVPPVFGDSLQLSGATLIYRSADGVEFSSNHRHQPETSVFEVLESTLGPINTSGQATQVLKVRVDAWLYNDYGDSIQVQTDASTFALGREF